MRGWKKAQIWGLGIMTLLLVGCGGGGGNGNTGDTGDPGDTGSPQAFSLSLAYVSAKTFRFTWSEVAGATEYRLLENPDGSSGFTSVATLAAGVTQHERIVFLPGRINARYLLQACNSNGCVDSNEVVVDPAQLVAAIGYVKASNTEVKDWFGTSVALSGDGDTLAVGARYEDSSATGIDGDQADNGATSSGAVYVFVRDANGNWAQQAYIKASNTDVNDGFGLVLALSGDGDTLAVGARSEDSAATGINGSQNNNGATNSGAVYVFVRDANGNWAQQAYVKASNTAPSDAFGVSLALNRNGDTLAVGARSEDSSATGIDGDQTDDGAPNSGAVYVFVRDAGGNWTQQAYVKASNTQGSDAFGIAVALSGDGNVLAVGAHLEDSGATGVGGNQADDTVSSAGAVYLFTRNGSTWSQQAYIKASNTGSVDHFGRAIALSGDGRTLAVGAPDEDSAATGINGDQNDDSAPGAGAVYLFVADASGNWTQQAYVKASNTGSGDLFGTSVALSNDGNTLVVGAESEQDAGTGLQADGSDDSASYAGAVYVFVRSGSVWRQQAYVKAPNTDAGDGFGAAVALAEDGATLVIGARGEDSGATGIDGDQADNSMTNAGAVYLY